MTQQDLRSEMVGKIHRAIRASNGTTPDHAQTAIEAAIIFAATAYAATNNIPCAHECLEGLANAALDGLHGWLEQWKERQ